VRELGPLLPLFALGVTLGLYTAYLEKTHVGAEGGDWDYGAIDRVLIAGHVIWFYAGKLAWPHPLVFIYPRWEISAAAPWQYAWPAGVVLAVLVLWLARRRIGSGPLVAVLFFIGTLLPCLGFVDVYPMRFSYVADHFQYHASIGLLALAAAAGAMLLDGGRARLRLPVAVLVLSVLGTLTWRQGYVYESARTLWEDTIAKNPDAFLAHHNLGYLYALDGDFARARELIRHSFELNPRYEVALNSMGVITLQARPVTRAHLAEAARYFQRAVEIRPVYFKARFDLAKTLYLLRRVDAAFEQARWAHEISPTHEGAKRLYEQLTAARAGQKAGR
jgi:tetratricopeptide (TPR) repeat protein